MTFAPQARPRRFRPRAEALESRDLPSALAPAPLQLVPFASRSGQAPLSPAQVRHAYGFDQTTFTANGQSVIGDGSGQTIAIVDAYDDPRIVADLQAFDKQFNLPDPVFTKATPERMPTADAGWAGEIALDVEWAHAIAPGARILLVETASASGSDLLNAVDYARHQPGVAAVSMSWGGSEFVSETSLDGTFTTPTEHTGVTFVASSGDSGAWYGASWPSVSPNILAVGGTTLRTDATGQYVGESGWSGSGGGFSRYETEPGFQTGVQRSHRRTNPDVAYDADPHTGFAVYDSFTGNSQPGGWYQVGGTSAGAPQWAALIAIADQGRALARQPALTSAVAAVYALPAADFHGVLGGYNGYFAGRGYNLVTGRGSPVANLVVHDLVATSSTAPTTTHPHTAPVGPIRFGAHAVFAVPDADWAYLPTAPAPAITVPAPAPASPVPMAGPVVPPVPMPSDATGRLPRIPSLGSDAAAPAAATALPAATLSETPTDGNDEATADGGDD